MALDLKSLPMSDLLLLAREGSKMANDTLIGQVRAEKERLIRQYASLANTQITLAKALEKYGTPGSTTKDKAWLHDQITQKRITAVRVGTGRGNSLLLNEGEVAVLFGLRAYLIQRNMFGRGTHYIELAYEDLRLASAAV